MTTWPRISTNSSHASSPCSAPASLTAHSTGSSRAGNISTPRGANARSAPQGAQQRQQGHDQHQRVKRQMAQPRRRSDQPGAMIRAAAAVQQRPDHPQRDQREQQRPHRLMQADKEPRDRPPPQRQLDRHAQELPQDQRRDGPVQQPGDAAISRRCVAQRQGLRGGSHHPVLILRRHPGAIPARSPSRPAWPRQSRPRNVDDFSWLHYRLPRASPSLFAQVRHV